MAMTVTVMTDETATWTARLVAAALAQRESMKRFHQ